MADKLTSIKIKQKNGSYTTQIPVSVSAQNVQWDGSHSLLDILGSVDINVGGKGNVQHQFDDLYQNIDAFTDDINSEMTDFTNSTNQSITNFTNSTNQSIADFTNTANQNFTDFTNATNQHLSDVLGNISTETKGTVQAQMDKLQNDMNTFHTQMAAEIGTDVSDWLQQNVTPAGSMTTIDSSLTISDAAADAKAVGDALTSLNGSLEDVQANINDVFTEFNIFQNVVERKKNVKWLRSGDLETQPNATTDIVKAEVSSDIQYFFEQVPEAYSRGTVRFSDASNVYTNVLPGFNMIISIPTGSVFVYMLVPTGITPTAIPATYYEKYTQGYFREIKDDVYNADAAQAKIAAEAADAVLNDIIVSTINLANRSEFTENKYMTANGIIGNSTSYYYTNKMPVAEGDIIYCTPAVRYSTAFNGDNVVSVSISYPFTVPSGITHLVVTGSMAEIDSLMVCKNLNLPYAPYGDSINNSYLRIDNKNAINGTNGLIKSFDSISADTTTELSEYPKSIGTHDNLTGYCEFSTFDTIFFGYGYPSNYVVEVDSTNIKIHYNDAISFTYAHGITISDYLSFAIMMNDDRLATITINSTGGSASTELSFAYNKDGLPFIRSTTALSNVKLSALSSDIRKSLWWFGDSYSSKSSERVIGQLNNFGILNNILIVGRPGSRSYYNENTGGYVDLCKLINFSKPKYIVWALGMNDTEANYKTYLLNVKNICDVYGIELYAVKVPSVPTIDNTGKNSYIDQLGIKVIDWAKAVNATAQGVWYTGYLSSDNVHPTVMGAQAMALRTLVDCPAIMQFN